MSDSIQDTGLWHQYISGAEASESVAAKRNAGSDLDKDAFLKLLVTQLQYQDPFNPLDDKEFIAQMAQFTSLEQMQNMNATTTKSQALNMIGSVVLGTIRDEVTNTYERVLGVVESVTIKNNEPYLLVNGVEMAMDDVEEITEYRLEQIGSEVATIRNLELVGKYVQTIVYNENKEPVEFIEGKVDNLTVTGDGLMLVIGNKVVSPADVFNIANGPVLKGRYVVTEIAEGLIEDVLFVNGKPRLVVGGKNIEIDNLEHVQDALRFVGTNISYGDVSGVVNHIKIANGKPYFVIVHEDGPDDEIKYTDYAKIYEKDDKNKKEEDK